MSKDGHAKGGTLMIGAAGCFTINDALCKWVMPEFAIGAIMTGRSVVVLVLIGTAALLSRGVSAQLVFRSYKLHIMRGCLQALSALLFLSGLALMPLTNALALSFMSPLFVALVARPVLGEHVDAKRWVAVVTGFVGSLCVLDPTIREFGWASVLPACAAMVSAVTDLMTRRMTSRESSLSLAVSGAAGAFVCGAATAIFGWQWGGPASLTLIGLAGIFVFLSYYFVAEAFRYAPASYVSPFRYSALLWGAAMAFVMWGDTPDANVVLGSAILIASGVYLGRVARTTEPPHGR